MSALERLAVVYSVRSLSEEVAELLATLPPSATVQAAFDALHDARAALTRAHQALEDAP